MKEYRVKPGAKVQLKDWSTQPPQKDEAFKEETKRRSAKLGLKLAELQELLWAEHKHRVLVLLQGLDTAGKDSTVRHVFSPINPQGLRVQSFKAPTAPELAHDYLWRIHTQAPANGEIAIFNRSHYEDVLVVRVRGLQPEKVWRRRYRQIVDFERLLVEEGTVVLKFFLHIDKDEQKKRLEQRLLEKRKQWKWDPADQRDRGYWDQYAQAYEEALERTGTDEAPWHIVPADKKWWRDYVVSETLVSALEELAMQYPQPKADLSKIQII